MAWIKNRKKLSRRERVLARLSPAERRRLAHTRLRVAAARLEVGRLAHRRPYALLAGAFGAGVALGFFPRLMQGLIAGARFGCDCAATTLHRRE
jgi:hypothetical protein